MNRRDDEWIQVLPRGRKKERKREGERERESNNTPIHTRWVDRETER